MIGIPAIIQQKVASTAPPVVPALVTNIRAELLENIIPNIPTGINLHQIIVPELVTNISAELLDNIVIPNIPTGIVLSQVALVPNIPSGITLYQVITPALVTGITADIITADNPIYSITTSSLGLVENDISEAVNNINKLIIAINNGDYIDVDGDYYVGYPTEDLTGTEVKLSSSVQGSFTSDRASLVLFDLNGLVSVEIYDLIFTDSINDNTARFAIFSDESDSLNTINDFTIKNCTFNNFVLVYNLVVDETLDPTGHNMTLFSFTENVVNNAGRSLIDIWNVTWDLLELKDNTINNFNEVILYAGIINEATFKQNIYDGRLLTVVSGNTAINENTWTGTNIQTNYFCMALVEGTQVDYEDNHVEGLWTNEDMAVYDAYLSCDIVNYKNNTNKNNVLFYSDKYANTLCKMKGASEQGAEYHRNIDNNHFIVEQSWIEGIGQDLALGFVNMAELGYDAGAGDTYVNMTNNTFDIYDLQNNSTSAKIHTYRCEDNIFNLNQSDHIFTELIQLSDTHQPTLITFKNNEVNAGIYTEANYGPSIVRVSDIRTDFSLAVETLEITGNTIDIDSDYCLWDITANNFIFEDNTISTDSAEIYIYGFNEFTTHTVNGDNNIINVTDVSEARMYEGLHLLGDGTTSSSSITYNGRFRNSGRQGIHFDKNFRNTTTVNYRRTYILNDIPEEFYYDFSIIYDSTNIQISFIDDEGTNQTFQLNNEDGIVEGSGTRLQLTRTGTNDYYVTFINQDGPCLFNITYTDIDEKSITIKTEII